jgi:hypothetical protein
MATLTTTGDIALLTAAPLVGMGIDRLGHTWAFSATAITIFVGSLVFVRWDRRIAQPDLVTEGVAG